jgi:hypothetical protein
MQRSEKMEDYIDKALLWMLAFIVCGTFVSAILYIILNGGGIC